MSNPFTLYVTLVEEGSGDTISRKILPISYSVSPDRSEVILGGSGRGEAATFVLNKLTPFLQEKRGLHLGRLYIPQLYLDGRSYYLQATPRKNHYLLSGAHSNNSFGFSILQPRLKWQERAEIGKIHFDNFDPGNATHYFLSTSRSEADRPFCRPRDQLIYSPTDCQGDESYCGASNPDLTETEDVGFGLRGQNVVYTYKVSPDRKTVTVAVTPSSLITADLETNDTVRERYFFVGLPESDSFQVGVDYPIYIWVGGQKSYLSRPRRLSENGPTTYELTSQPEQDTARFSPMAAANWREMTLSPNDFINLAFNNIPELALWRDESYQGLPAVIASDSYSLGAAPTEVDVSPYALSHNPAPALLAAYPQPPTTFVPVFNVSQEAPTPSAPPDIVTVLPFWMQWWFWLLIGILLILLIVLIVVLSRPRTPEITTVSRSEPISYVRRE